MTRITREPKTSLHRLKFGFSPLGFQIFAISLFAVGGVLGVVGDNGILFSPLRIELKWHHATAALLIFAVIILMLALTSVIKPFKLPMIETGEKTAARVIASVIAVGAGWGLLFFNLQRLSVFDLITTNPAAIAFNITEQGGAVLFFSSMSIFYVGAIGLLDCIRSRVLTFFIAILIVAFTIGVMLTTRRELIMIVIAWGAFLLVHRISAIKTILIMSPVVVTILVAALSFRNIDVLESPLEYFTSGEFEPMRFAVFLTDRWIDNIQFISPLEYSLPFMLNTKVIGQVNAAFAQLLFYNESALGIPTITFFTTFFYLGALVPLVFYIIHVFVAKQFAGIYRKNGSKLMSFAYVFSLVKLMLFIRNGELFESLIDSIVLLIFLFSYMAASGIRFAKE